ncbi:NADPH-dependent FMN reductase [Mariniblastus fucicola]|uniref:NADPH-dependent FMN reductase n=1 Tax=Mariniblastus fucicola TaxID=980251 RepID=A0A5B9PC28_9BACT|nr:NAD(P)H-dependent oxidoreductase [Mariniblastus fucicola]QEG23039.1 NADPH-dependent FMN reductase [Mariniblastus fucicola]
MKILAIAATNSRNSINKALVTHAGNVLQSEVGADATLEVVDLNDFDAPIYGIDRETESGIPEAAKKLFEKIGLTDVLLISYAEHNGNYTAAWKSIFDWMSRIEPKVFQGKPMVILSTSPGKGGAANVLKIASESALYFGADVKASLSVPLFGDNFDVSAGKLSDDELAGSLLAALNALKA